MKKNYIIWSVSGIIAIVFVLFGTYTIKSTERGVLSTFGKMSESVVEPGFHVKWPFIQSIQKVNVQQKKRGRKRKILHT